MPESNKSVSKAGAIAAEPTALVPVIKPDSPIKSEGEDKLNRSGIASGIARAILTLDAKESVVIGIHGPWGSGKTSLLNLLQERLEADSTKPPLILRFNPWDFADQNQLTSQFFNDLATFLRLHQSLPRFVKIADVVDQYGKLLDPLARLIAPRIAEASKLGWSLFRKAKPAVSRTSIDLKAQIDKALKAAATKIIILIDDVDRLNSTEIRQLFQLIKVNANFTNTVYVVAFDRASVEKALVDVSPGPPGEYLEKIIQVSFPLPPISDAKLSQLIIDEFNATLQWFKVGVVNEQRFGNMFVSGFRDYFRTLRDVTRYFNLFRFALAMIGDDTNFIDLAVVQAFALFEPEAFLGIESHPRIFSGSVGYREDKTSLSKEYEEVFSLIRTERRKRVESLCRFLFPKVEFILSNTSYGHEWEQEWERERRIASPKYFPFYFQLAVPEGEVSQIEMSKALDATDSVDKFVNVLAAFNKTKRFSSFVDLLRNSLDDLNRSQLLVILESIFVYGDHVSLEGTGGFGVISDHLRFASWLLLDLLDKLKEGRFAELMERMRDRPAVYTVANTAAFFEEIMSGKEDASSFRQKYPELNNEVVGGLRSIALQVIRTASSQGTLLDAPGLPRILYLWKRWTDEPSLVTGWIQRQFLQDYRGAIALIQRFSSEVRSYGLSDRVPQVRTAISFKALSDFVSLDELAALVKDAPTDVLTQEQQRSVKLFMRGKERIDKGADPESIDMMFRLDEANS